MKTKNKKFKLSQFASAFERARTERLESSRACYHEAGMLAREFGLIFRRHSDIHYTLKSDEWVLHIYPAAQRVSWEPKQAIEMLRQWKPMLLESPWHVLDVVKAVVEASQ